MTSRGLTIALLISGALNVFVVGAAAGLFASGALPRPHGHNPLHDAADRLDPTNRKALSDLLRNQAQANAPLMNDARAARSQAVQLMQAQPFDAAATSAALARARADDQQVRGHIEEAVVAFAAKLTPDERSRLSAGLTRAQHHRDRYFGRMLHGGPPSDHP